MIPALEAPRGDTPAERRAALGRLPDDWLADRLLAWVLALREGGSERWEPLAEAAGLPLGEVVASPFALRAVALATAEGATTAHRELRSLALPSDAAWAPEVRDAEHGTWERGVLRAGKYEGFQQDAPFAVFDPAHGAKWGPHELMHRATGFFWRRDASRWEHYLGARLGELLPVVLWYGPDQVARHEDDDVSRHRGTREAPVSAARWLQEDPSTLRARLRRSASELRAGLEHLAIELAALDAERESGHRRRTVHFRGDARLDAASDATAYVVGHAERLALPELAAVLERLPEGRWRHASVEGFREHVEVLFDRLLFAELTWTPAASDRDARELWDLGLRAGHRGTAPPAALLDALSARVAGDTTAPMGPVWDALADEDPQLVANGLRDGGWDLDQLAEGVASLAPATATRLAEQDPGWPQGFAGSDALWRRAPLAERLRAYRATIAPEDRLGAELLSLEVAVATRAADDRIRYLGAPEGTRVVASSALEVLRFGEDVVGLHARLRGDAGAPATALRACAVVGDDDEVAVIPLPAGAADLLERATTGHVDPEELEDVLGESLMDALLELGALTYLTP
ncbi:MAG: hypothetical protein AAGH15_12190 [Myxococcota bacterium]